MKGTRQSLMTEIDTWLAEPKSEERILWLNGMAGTGKTTISRTVARNLDENGYLGASYFFSRGQADLDSATKLVPTIANQLANKIPILRRYICEAIATHRNICERTMADQWKELVVKPLSKVETQRTTPTIVILVDALDECDSEEEIRNVTKCISGAPNVDNFSLRFILTSRPESHIRAYFRPLVAVSRNLALHEVSQDEMDNDITVYLTYEFGCIREDNGLDDGWPGKQVIALLSQRAGGLFIYAATACRFVRDRRWLPEDRLKLIIAGQRHSKSPTAELDDTYTEVLQQSVLGDCDEEEKDILSRRFRQIVGSVIVLFEALNAKALSKLLNVPERMMQVTLSPLGAVLAVPDDSSGTVRILHPTFRDYLLDSDRCSEEAFHVDDRLAHEAIARRCINIMSSHLSADISDLHRPAASIADTDRIGLHTLLPFHVRYACTHWTQHLARANIQLADDDEIHLFLKRHLLHWIEALTLMRRGYRAQKSLKHLRNMTQVRPIRAWEADQALLTLRQPINCYKLLELLYDALRLTSLFYMSNSDTLKLKHPLQIYLLDHLLPRKPDELVYWDRSADIAHWMHVTWAQLPVKSSPEHYLPYAQVRNATALVGSPSGIFFASTHDSGKVKVWNTETGRLHARLPLNCSVLGGSFSLDGKLMAMGSVDHSIVLWDDTEHRGIYTLKGHQDTILAFAFSADHSLLASASADTTIMLWDVTTGESRGTLAGHKDAVTAIAFFDGQTLVSGSQQSGIKIWECNKLSVKDEFSHCSGLPTGLTVSPQQDLLAISYETGTLEIWSIAGKIMVDTVSAPGSQQWLGFSTDGSHLLTDRGPIWRKDPTATCECCPLSIEGQWICWNGNRVLCLPLDSLRKSICVVRGDSVVVYSLAYFRIAILRFDPEKMRVLFGQHPERLRSEDDLLYHLLPAVGHTSD